MFPDHRLSIQLLVLSILNWLCQVAINVDSHVINFHLGKILLDVFRDHGGFVERLHGHCIAHPINVQIVVVQFIPTFVRNSHFPGSHRSVSFLRSRRHGNHAPL